MGLPETLTLNSGTERVGLAILKQFHHFILGSAIPTLSFCGHPTGGWPSARPTYVGNFDIIGDLEAVFLLA